LTRRNRQAVDAEDDHCDGDSEPAVHGADPERVPPQFGLRLAPDEQAGRAREHGARDGAADDPRLGPHERVAAEVGAPAQQHDHVQRDGHDREVGGGAVELGQMRHAAAR
jgi:hypothetical protein